MGSVELLQALAGLGGVTCTELSACSPGTLQPQESWLLGHVLLSSHASSISGALDAILGSSCGNDILRSWVEEAVIGGFGDTAAPAPGLLPESLPAWCECELRRTVEASLTQFLDAQCCIHLARLGYYRSATWSTPELERELSGDFSVHDDLHRKIVGWLCSGLAQQTKHLLEGLGLLVALHGVLRVAASERIDPQTALKVLLRMKDVTHGCLLAAAPLVKNKSSCWEVLAQLSLVRERRQHDERLTALFALRVMDWAFRRVEIERPRVLLRLDWRLLSAELFWSFVTSGGTKAGGATEVVQAFAIKIVLPVCRGKSELQEGGAASSTAGANTTPEQVSVPSEGLGLDKPVEGEASPAAKRGAHRRKRAQRKDKMDAEPEDAQLGSDKEAEPNEAMREWNRLSLRMMLDMGWRAEDGSVQ